MRAFVWASLVVCVINFFISLHDVLKAIGEHRSLRGIVFGGSINLLFGVWAAILLLL